MFKIFSVSIKFTSCVSDTGASPLAISYFQECCLHTTLHPLSFNSSDFLSLKSQHQYKHPHESFFLTEFIEVPQTGSYYVLYSVYYNLELFIWVIVYVPERFTLNYQFDMILDHLGDWLLGKSVRDYLD